MITRNGKKLSEEQMRAARKKAALNREITQKYIKTRYTERQPASNRRYTDGAASDFCQSDHPEFGNVSDETVERVRRAVKKRLAPGGGGSAFGYENPIEKYADERLSLIHI